MAQVTIIYEGSDPATAEATAEGENLWVSLADAQRIGGWELKPEGLCRETICIPVPDASRDELLRGDGAGQEFNLGAFARLIEQPLAHDDASATWLFGAPSWEWQSRLVAQTAPDFTLPDFDGTEHSLSELRGQKVFLLCWASWCSCRFDLPIWQALREELHDKGFEVLTVATESKGAATAQPFIDAAQPTHPSLLDERHLVPELYNTRNIPAAFWIDEQGKIVRANDPIYAERRNPQTGEAKRNDRYLDAVRDWVEKGPASEFVQDRSGVQAAMGEQSFANEQAAAHFRLALHLQAEGKAEEAIAQMKRAHELQPDNWNYKRQAWNLAKIEEYGYANVIEAIRDPNAPQFYRQVDIVNQ